MPPIRELKLFVRVDCNLRHRRACTATSTELLQQERKSSGGVVERPRRLAGVKHVDNVEPKVALQPFNVRVRTVKDFDDAGV